MSSTIISPAFSTHSTPVLTERCGEVYCSQNLEEFLVNCLRCAQKFNLLSCTLFIKHIKECLPNEGYELTQRGEDNLESSFSAVDDVESTEQPIQQIDPLMTIKEEDCKEKREVSDGSICEDVEYLSDYQNEDELPLDKLARRKIVEGIINEYKKHPVLWDTRLSVRRADKVHAYKKIRNAVNLKYKSNFSYIELRTQIQNLRCGYRRVLRRKKVFEQHFADGTKPFNPMLWFFDKISFIEGTNQDYKVDLTQNSESDEEVKEADGNESSDSSSDSAGRELKKTKKERPSTKILSEPEIISEIISQYKQYPFLWDQTSPLYSDRHARKDAFRRITKFINQKFQKNVTDKELRQQIINLRGVYRRVQRERHKPNYRIHLWYYDELSFIDNKAHFDEKVSDEFNQTTKHEEDLDNFENPDTSQSADGGENNEIIKHESNSECDDEEDKCDAGCDNDEHSNVLSCRKKNNKLILSLIEEYKKHPCLWDYQFKTAGRFKRYDAIEEITSAVNAKHQTSFTKSEIRNKLVQLRSSYRRALRKKEAFEKKHANAKRKLFPHLWYFDRMTFIGAKDSDFLITRRKKTKSYCEVDEDETSLKKGSGSLFKQSKVLHNLEHETFLENVVMSDELESSSLSKQSKVLHNLKLQTFLENMVMSDEPESSSLSKQSKVLHNLKHETFLDNKVISDELESRSFSKKSKMLLNPKEDRAPILRAVIEEYKRRQCLWDGSLTKGARKKNLKEICEVINQKLDTSLTYQNLDREMSVLASLQKKDLVGNVSGSEDDSKLFANFLSFIKNTQNSESKENSVSMGNEIEDFPGTESPTNENNSSADDQVCQSESPVNNKEIVFKIIELYKDARILWDINHPQYRLRTERKKSIETIITKLSEEHNCRLTVEEFRYQIRFLKNSYFRALHQKTTAKQANLCNDYAFKPFFFDEMSFLEPSPTAIPVTPTDLQIPKEQQQDFASLCENKPLMLRFIELYKMNGCLWDQNHKDRRDASTHAVAYSKMINMFRQHGEDFTEERVRSAVSFLQSVATYTQKTVWFYEHLKFLERIPRIKDKYCTHCNQHFHSLSAYEKHKIEIVGDYPYKCEVCNAGFISRSKFAYHQVTHKEPHKCDQCDFQAFDKHNFNVHMRRHKGIHLFRCDECNKGFVTSSELNRHLRMHTGEKAYICEICGKALVSNAEYHHHMKRHRNQRDHKCEICGSAFFTAKALKGHMATHSSERHHVCDVCGLAFKRKKTLLQHIAIHMEKKKHECSICGKLFAQKAGVYSHMKSHGQVLGS